MTAPFPHQYEVAVACDGKQGIVSSPPHPPLVGGAPPQFDGKDGWWSPEDLLLGAIGLCHMTTFQAFARRANLAVQSYTSRAVGTLDKTSEGLRFTRLRLQVDVAVAEGDRERAAKLVESAERHCIVSNSLRIPVELEYTVTPA